MGAGDATLFFKTLTLLLVFSATIGDSSQAALNRNTPFPSLPGLLGTSAVFPLSGNVYPDGHYTVSLRIGNRAQPFVLDVDTGSDLSWLQCDLHCVGCTKPRGLLYQLRNNLISCRDPICPAIPGDKYPCTKPTDQCDYQVDYVDHSSSLGVVVRDYSPLQFTNGSQIPFTFGCGYNQHYPGSVRPPSSDGVLGLGIGKVSILSQLHDMGLIRNVFAHCLSSRGGGVLFLGDKQIPSSGVTWAPTQSSEQHYTIGPMEILLGGQSTGVKNILLIFDSGSTYTYFNSAVYQHVLSMIRNGLNGKLKEAPEDKTLPVCWKGAKPFKTVNDVKSYFKPLALSMSKNAQLQIPPEGYLIISKPGNVCLGVLYDTQLGSENIIGDISLQDKLVIYDNERKRMGWISANCDKQPRP